MSFDNTGKQLEYVRYGASWPMIKQNLSMIKHLMTTQGHWGGIHAVYNIYNATRICELRQFANDNNVTVLWQNLFQPIWLDPCLHDAKVAALAIEEIEKFYAMDIATPIEHEFFDQILNKYQSNLNSKQILNRKFAFQKHIRDIETVYHPDQAGNFVKLWPELAFLCE